MARKGNRQMKGTANNGTRSSTHRVIASRKGTRHKSVGRKFNGPGYTSPKMH